MSSSQAMNAGLKRRALSARGFNDLGNSLGLGKTYENMILHCFIHASTSAILMVFQTLGACQMMCSLLFLND